MSIVSRYDLLVTAITNFKTDAEAASASNAIKSQTRDRAIRLAYSVEAELKNEGAEIRAVASTQGI